MIEHLNFDPLVLCIYTDWGGMKMGSSVNIDDITGDNPYHIRSLVLKIPILPKSDFFNQVTITDGKLILKIRDDNKSENSLNDRFVIFNGLCENISWNEDSHPSETPCIGTDKRPHTKMRVFGEPVKTNIITDIEIDIKLHLEYAQKNNLNTFTEIIEFHPIQFIEGFSGFNSEQRKCLYSANNVIELTDCVSDNQITVFSSEHEEGNGPILSLSYNVKPTAHFQAWTTALLAVVPIIISLIIYRNKQVEEHNSKMRTACKTIKAEIEDTKLGLTRRYERFDEAYIIYDKDSDPLIFKLKKKIHLVYLPRDAYLSIIYSGTIMYFLSKHQTEIISLFENIEQYNNKQIYVEKIIDDAKKQFKNSDAEREHTKWYLEKIVGKYYEYLGELRTHILSKINKVDVILDEEIKRFSAKTYLIKLPKVFHGKKRN